MTAKTLRNMLKWNQESLNLPLITGIFFQKIIAWAVTIITTWPGWFLRFYDNLPIKNNCTTPNYMLVWTLQYEYSALNGENFEENNQLLVC